MITAVVLASGRDRGELAARTGVVHRPLLEVGGRTIVQAVVGALRGSSSVGPVVLVAPEAVQAAAGSAVDARAAEGSSLVGSIANGLAAAPAEASHLLLITADLPLLTGEAVDDFVTRCQQARPAAEVYYPIIRREACERQFPGGRRTYVRLREGAFTGGNAVIATRGFLERSQELIERLYAWRKSPLRLAGLFGLPFILGLIAGRLSLGQLEARASAIISGQVRAIISGYPELGFDVDKLEDLEAARRAAANRGGTVLEP